MKKILIAIISIGLTVSMFYGISNSFASNISEFESEFASKVSDINPQEDNDIYTENDSEKNENISELPGDYVGKYLKEESFVYEYIVVYLSNSITEETISNEMNEKEIDRMQAMYNLYYSLNESFVVNYLSDYETNSLFYSAQITIKVDSLTEEELSSLVAFLEASDEVGSIQFREQYLVTTADWLRILEMDLKIHFFITIFFSFQLQTISC